MDSAKKRIFRSTEISKDQWTVLNLPPSSFSVIVFSVIIIGMSYIIMLISTLCIISFDTLQSFLWGGLGHFPLQSGHQHSLLVSLFSLLETPEALQRPGFFRKSYFSLFAGLKFHLIKCFSRHYLCFLLLLCCVFLKLVFLYSVNAWTIF